MFTNPEVVYFMLDPVGRTSDHDPTELRILGPSFGNGGFLLPVVDRLLTSRKARRPDREPHGLLHDCLKGVELHRNTASATEPKMIAKLQAASIGEATAQDLAGA